MKIRVALTVEIDPAKWSEYGGNGESAAEVREDVRGYVLSQVQGAALVEECDGSVDLAR